MEHDGKLRALVSFEVRLQINVSYDPGLAICEAGKTYPFHILETGVMSAYVGYRQWVTLRDGEYEFAEYPVQSPNRCSGRGNGPAFDRLNAKMI